MKYVLLLSLLCITLCAHAQTRERILVSYAQNKDATTLYGYKDLRGKIVIAARYRHIETDTFRKIAFVYDADMHLLCINQQGIVLLRPFIFDNGADYLQEGLFRYVENNKTGFANDAGQKVIPAVYDFASPFNEGLCAFNLGGHKEKSGEHTCWTGGKWGYINKAGKIVIPALYTAANSFRNGRAEVKDKDGKTVFINRTGKIIK